MDTQPKAVAHEEVPTGAKSGRHTVLAQLRSELVQVGRRQGYLEYQQWQTIVGRMVAHHVPLADQAQLRAELARVAAAQNWLFPDDTEPSERIRRLTVLVEHARSQARRTSIMTQGYLSSLLALGYRWGLAHDEVAQELARCCVAERWPVDWELACEMEGLLGAELADDRQRETRSWARAQFEHRGRKGWLTKSDLLQLYAGVRVRGVSELDARALLNSFHAEADVRYWAWAGASPAPSETDDRLQLLVGKVAAQARRRRHVTEGFRQALLAEVAGAKVDTRMLLDALAERRRREHWSASFDPCWELGGDESSPWWERIFLHMRQSTARRLIADLSPSVRPVAPSWLRIATPLLLLLTTISFNCPIVASSAAALASPQSALTAPTNLVLSSVAPTAVIGASAAPGARHRSAAQAGRVACEWWGRTATDRAGDRTGGAAAE